MKAFKWVDLVFLGELIESGEEEYSFLVLEIFKGKPEKKTLKGKYFDSCCMLPRDPGRWIVYADLEENGFLNITFCLPSRSEINPVCIGCYTPPYLPSPEYPDSLKIDWERATEQERQEFLAQDSIYRQERDTSQAWLEFERQWEILVQRQLDSAKNDWQEELILLRESAKE